MAFHRTAIGLDMGAQSLKGVQVKVIGNEARVVRSFALRRESLQAEGVEVSDPQELAPRLREAMDEARFPSRRVVLGIDGRESIIRYAHMPPMAAKRLETVMKYEVESVADRMEESLAAAYTILPLRRDDGEQTILLGLAKDEPLTELLGALERVGITVTMAVPGPLALYGAWDLYGAKDDPDSPEDDLVVAVDLGASNLHTALVHNNRLAFARSATFGGDNFTEALAGSLGISTYDAERVKVARGGVDESFPGVASQTVGPLRGLAGQLLGNVQSSIRFCSSQAGVQLPPVTRLWLTGGGMRLRGLPEYLSRALGGKPFERFDPAGASGDNGAGAKGQGSLGLALGLSSVGLRPEGDRAGSLNILPDKYRVRREFRERTFFLYAAGAMLVLCLIAQLIHGIMVSSAANSLKKELRGRLTELQKRQAEQEESIVTSASTRARINRLLGEVEPSAFQAFVLHLLAESLRPEIKLDKIELEPRARDADGGFDYLMVIEGRVSDEKRKGLDWILELQEILMREERISDVQPLGGRREGPWYTFSLAIVPNTSKI